MKIASRPAAVAASVVAVLLLGSSLTAAQPKAHGRSGLFVTAADFTEGRLSFEGDCSAKTHNVNVHDFLHRRYVDVTHDSKRYRYQKSNLFGFRACDGRRYRFGGTREYEVLEAKEIYIYAYQAWVRAGRISRKVRYYSFSVGPDGPLLSLTPDNLKRAFPGDSRFHASLDRLAGPTGVQKYDQAHQMFTVNWLRMTSREPER
jgi:hypothetical protein